eukprot:Tbor_TRINITY_DN5768_c0_g1::TRINITY_DN5768_c0_g1_i1::g.19563::m.19563
MYTLCTPSTETIQLHIYDILLYYSTLSSTYAFDHNWHSDLRPKTYTFRELQRTVKRRCEVRGDNLHATVHSECWRGDNTTTSTTRVGNGTHSSALGFLITCVGRP